MHERTTGAAISDDEVELLFDLFDTDSDGRLRVEEVGAASSSVPSAAAQGPGAAGEGEGEGEKA